MAVSDIGVDRRQGVILRKAWNGDDVRSGKNRSLIHDIDRLRKRAMDVCVMGMDHWSRPAGTLASTARSGWGGGNDCSTESEKIKRFSQHVLSSIAGSAHAEKRQMPVIGVGEYPV